MPEDVLTAAGAPPAAPSRPAVVVHVVDSLRPGGAERLIVTTVKHLDRGRFTPVVVALAPPLDLRDELVQLGVMVEHLGMRGPLDVRRGVFALARVLRRHGADIVHTHLRFANVHGRLAAALARAPHVVTSLHHLDYTHWPARGWRGRLWKTIDRLTARTINDAFIAVSSAVREDYRRHFGLREVALIHNYVEARPDVTVDADAAARGRREFGWSADDFVLLDVARLAPEKGQRDLVQALPRILAEVPEARLLLAGDGPDREPLRRRAAELGVATRVAFAGDRHDVDALLAMADVFVFPSVAEGLGIALMEAMRAGRPVVSCAVDGIPEVVSDGVDGLLVPPARPEALADAIVRLHRDPELRQRLAARGRETVAARFVAEGGVARLESFYTSLLGGGGQGRESR